MSEKQIFIVVEITIVSLSLCLVAANTFRKRTSYKVLNTMKRYELWSFTLLMLALGLSVVMLSMNLAFGIRLYYNRNEHDFPLTAIFEAISVTWYSVYVGAMSLETFASIYRFQRILGVGKKTWSFLTLQVIRGVVVSCAVLSSLVLFVRAILDVGRVSYQSWIFDIAFDGLLSLGMLTGFATDTFTSIKMTLSAFNRSRQKPSNRTKYYIMALVCISVVAMVTSLIIFLEIRKAHIAYAVSGLYITISFELLDVLMSYVGNGRRSTFRGRKSAEPKPVTVLSSVQIEEAPEE